MRTIADKRSKARDIGRAIQNWRLANVSGYLFDKNYKHQTEQLWFVELDDENVFGFEVMELPEGWFKEIETLT